MFQSQFAELYNGILTSIMMCYMIYRLNADLKRSSFLNYILSCLTITTVVYIKEYVFSEIDMFVGIAVNILVVVSAILVFHKYNIYYAAITAIIGTLIIGFADVFLALAYVYPFKITLLEYRSSIVHISIGSSLMFLFIYFILKISANKFIKARRRLNKENKKLMVVLSANLISVLAILLFVYNIFGYYLNFKEKTDKGNSAYYSIVLITVVLIASIVGTLYIINYLILNRLKYERLKMNHVMDVMTDTLNRVSGLKFIDEQLRICKQLNKDLTICFIDINDLKVVNDMHGHRKGDELIKVIVGTIKGSIRDSDAITRLGGDEFVIIFPGCNIEHGKKVMNRINERLRELDLFQTKDYTVSISYGFSEYDGDTEITVDGLLDKADQQMYLNKRAIKALV